MRDPSASPDPVWTPDPERVRASRLTQFVAQLPAGTLADDSYASLHRWSVDCPSAFWAAVAGFCGVQFDTDAETVLADGDRMPGARWFPASRLNFARHLLRGDPAQPAIIGRDERGRRRELNFTELRGAVAAAAAGMVTAGVRPGDRVAALMPNQPETVIAMLAAASIGAVFSSCSPDFGADGVVDRFGQIAPALLIVADGYHYAGKTFDTRPLAAEVARRIDSIRQVVVVPFVNERPALAVIPGAQSWAAFCATGNGGLEFGALPFDHPLYILYSSGTTGVPKCIVHGAGGTLLKHLEEHALQTDLRAGDRFFYFTTCGWMMWHWLASGLASGATIVLYDGSPFYPDPGQLWRIAAEERIEVFGTSAKYLAAVEKTGYRPGASADTVALRTLLSTGSPLAPSGFDFVYRDIKPDVHLASISGGTDLIGCFVTGNPNAPVWRGEIQCAALGMAVDVLGEAGRPRAVGEKGELVCTRPFPSMPVGFWDDPDGARYQAAYFDRFDGCWAHGDFAEKTANGGYVIHGRADAVLNPGGVRIGTAELYRQVEKVSEVIESIAISQHWDDDVRIVLFVVLRDGVELDDALEARIRSNLRNHASPRHVPAKILAVPEIPRTRSGKIVELAVRAAVHGEPVTNTGAIANPEALEHFRNRPELGEP